MTTVKDPEPLTQEQVKDLGETLARSLREDLSKHITDILPEALKHHGLDLGAMKAVKRLPMSEAAADGKAEARPGWHGWDANQKRYLEKVAAMPNDWKAFGEYLRAIHPIVNRGQIDARLKASNEAEGGAGGFLVPEQFVANLLMLSLEMAVVRPRAFVMPMAAEHIRIPAVRDTSHATNVFGGVQAYWTAESGSLTESNPTFRQIGLTARKLTGYTTVTNELLADSAIGLEALLGRMFGEAIAYFEDDAFLTGTGAGQPTGVLNSGALVSVSKESGQAAATIVAENLDKMYSRMLPSSMNRAVWLAHPDTFPQLAALSRSVGTGGSSVWMMNMAGGPPATIYGRPLIFTEKCEALGTLGDIYFADFSYYLIGQRQDMTMAASPHVRFTNDETVYRFVSRLDATPWLDSPLTPRNGSSTVSAFVALAARA